MTKDEAKETADASCYSTIIDRIKYTANNGTFSITVTDCEINNITIEKLKKLGYFIRVDEFNNYYTISWRN